MKHTLFHRPSKEYLLILSLRTFGNFLILSSLFFIFKTVSGPISAEYRYYIDQRNHVQYVVAPTQDEAPRIVREYRLHIAEGGLTRGVDEKHIEALIPIDPEFSIVIPKIAANARVLANVNAADKTAYLDALQKGVAHAEGTAFPGEHGHIFLFAHSTDYFWNVGRYNAVFYLLYKLNAGDDINIFFKGQRYVYRVREKKIVSPEQLEYLTRKTTKELLTLQTCWPPGTTLQRLLVFAERVAE